MGSIIPVGNIGIVNVAARCGIGIGDLIDRRDVSCRDNDLDFVVPFGEITEAVFTIRTRCDCRDGDSVDLGTGSIGVEQGDHRSGDTGLSGILDAVMVGIAPNEGADGDCGDKTKVKTVIVGT